MDYRRDKARRISRISLLVIPVAEASAGILARNSRECILFVERMRGRALESPSRVTDNYWTTWKAIEAIRIG
jgi:hypothetical protein